MLFIKTELAIDATSDLRSSVESIAIAKSFEHFINILPSSSANARVSFKNEPTDISFCSALRITSAQTRTLFGSDRASCFSGATCAFSESASPPAETGFSTFSPASASARGAPPPQAEAAPDSISLQEPKCAPARMAYPRQAKDRIL